MSKLVVGCLVVLTLVLVPGLSTPVFASTDVACFANLADCFGGSASLASFWDRTWDALDCELSFISCVRIAVFGL